MRVLKWLYALLLPAMLCFGPGALAEEKILLETKSPYSTIVVSEDASGLRILRFGRYGARQSVVKLGDPEHLELAYARVLPMAFVFVPEPKSALVIGLGGGTIPSFLRKRFPQMRIDAVDIDPGVVAVAKSHFGFREDEHMRAHIEDGRKFVESTSARYDLVFLDGFGTDSVPPHLTTREFLTSVQRILAPGGAVIGNLWGRDVNRLYDSMVKTYRTVYGGVQIIDVIGSGNKILIATREPTKLAGWEIVQRATQVTRKHRLRNDLTEIAERNLRDPGNDGNAGALLTDSAVTAPAGER